MLVAKVLPTKQIAYVCHNGMEIPKYSFEVSATTTKSHLILVRLIEIPWNTEWLIATTALAHVSNSK